ncbi:MAG: DUF371 domain-containing protein [Candidatus Woesearchaeota archaeon]|jgi:hypothetical protein|nr:DUF371 domain-containing protein [Candidatus Woesearchaeota archaeon]MDP7622525.1 DUF371 domain-containing protein [Candidatus Woesearchaeota archaeon]HJN56577.1 DUF371 domain-containing protein [Candidatus Woesearchaeota archaeon]|tara:strand:- start:54033 stop:54458 length:426 start_codon:yes stop_codon:yes gene_type:complete
MEYSFNCYGHENVISRHKTTLEFTKGKNLTLNGDCIVGVNADFDLHSIKKFIASATNNKKIKITIKNNEKGLKEEINAELNPNFDSDSEMVIRKSDFISNRTFAINADKSAFELNNKLIEFLKGKENKVVVTLRMGWIKLK